MGLSSKLGGQDTAFVVWESVGNPMHIAAVAHFDRDEGGAAVDLKDLQAELCRSIALEPRLYQRLEPGTRWRLPRWKIVGSLDETKHIRTVGWTYQAGERLGLLDAEIAEPLDMERPPWEIVLIQHRRPSRRFSLLIKVHHSLVDGRSGVELLERLLGSQYSGAERALGRRSTRRKSRRPSRLLPALAHLLGALRPRESFLRAGSGGRRRHSTTTLALPPVLRTAEALGASPNDVALAIVGAGLARWREGRSLLGASDARALVPVDLRASQAQPDGPRGNRISFWLIDLLTGAPNLEARVAGIRAQTSRARRENLALGGALLGKAIEWLGPWSAAFASRLSERAHAFDLVVTSVRAPRTAIELLGHRLEDLTAYAPLAPGQGLSIAFVAHPHHLRLGICDRNATPERAQALVDAVRSASAECVGVAEDAAA